MDTQGGKRPADTLSGRLAQIRHERGWSQREAAEVTGVPFGTWQGMEAGGRRTMSLDQHIQRIADATGYDRDWIMWGDPPNRNNDRYRPFLLELDADAEIAAPVTLRSLVLVAS